MPIPVPFPDVAPTVYERGALPQITVSRGGVDLALTLANGWVILPGVEGLDGPPPALIDVEPATWDGSLNTGARYTARDVFLPLHYKAADTDSLRTAIRALAVLTDPKRGAVTVEVAHADGDRRTIDGFLSAPFGQALASTEGTLWRQVGLTIRCPDPFWQSTARTLMFGLGGDPGEFLSDEFLPVDVDDAQVTGEATIVVDGDADAYPTVTLVGPFSDADITLGQAHWTVPDGLVGGEVMVIDMGRGIQTVTVDDAPAWGSLGPGAQLGPLEPGDNTLSATLTGATDDTRMTVAWTQRWLTAW